MVVRILCCPSATKVDGAFLTALFAALYAGLMGLGVLWGQESGGGVIFGRVTGERGQPQVLLVHLFSEGEVPAGDSYTDADGNFSFRTLPNGTYYVVAQTEGYRPARVSVLLDMKMHPSAQVSLALEPLESTNKPPIQAVPGSPRSQKLDAHAPARPIDARALREFERGNRAQRQGNFHGAITHYQKALHFDPACYPALNNLGAVFLRQKDKAQAEAAFERSLKLDPEDGEAYINLGHVLYEEAKYRQAIQRLQEGLRRTPQSAVAHFFLGSSYLQLGEIDQAEPLLKRAAALDPNMAPAHLQLANLYLTRRETLGASRELQIYLQQKPDDPQASAIKKLLANLKAR
jgi:Tfp pilus assembly protein PilF